MLIHWRRRRAAKAQLLGDTPEPEYDRALLVVLALWLVLYSSLVFVAGLVEGYTNELMFSKPQTLMPSIQPGNPEMWIMGLVPLFLVLAGLSARQARQRSPKLFLLGVILFGALNYFGGMGMLRTTEGDYNYQKSKWILTQAQEDDIILTAGNPVFVRYLRYHAEAEVQDLFQWSGEDFERWSFNPRLSENEVYVLGDVLQPPASLSQRFPVQYERIITFARDVENQLTPVHFDEFGGVRVWRRSDAQ
jgi:hypothetical protein